MPKRLKAEIVRQAARGRWLHILGALAGDVLGDALSRRPGTHVDCPFHGGKEDFRLDGPRSRLGGAAENGGAICTCGQWKDGFALLMEARGWTFVEALQAVANYLGLSEAADRSDDKAVLKRLDQQRRHAERARQQREREAHQRQQRAIRQIREVWDRGLPILDRRALPLRLYLAGRGLSPLAIAQCPDIRFHPALPCFQKTDKGLSKIGDFPAMVAMVRDAAGQPATLHRTYLTREGAKLPVKKPKKLMENATDHLVGGAIRLFPPTEHIGVAEGIETALSVYFAIGMPTWPLVSASLLKGFEPPETVHRVTIWADHDRSKAGIEAARSLQQRLWRQGVETTIRLPDLPIPENAKSVDWNDVWTTQGALGFLVPHKERLTA